MIYSAGVNSLDFGFTGVSVSKQAPGLQKMHRIAEK